MNARKGSISAGLAVLALGIAAGATAQYPISGYVLEDDCATPVDNVAQEGELYVIKVRNGTSVAYTDWLFDLRTKNGGQAGLAELGSVGYLVPANWTFPDTVQDDVHVLITYADGVVALDSGNIGTTLGTFNFVRRQHVGDSLPSGPPLQGRDLVLSQGAGQYSVDLGGGRTVSFPYGTHAGISIAFAPLAEVQNTDLSAATCTWGGEVPDMNSAPPTEEQGLIRGYNVYRLEGTAGSPPPITLVRQLRNWTYFVDLRALDLDATGLGQDLNPDGDLTGIDNDDGLPYTGDEIVFFSDANANPNGSTRAGGTYGPVPGQGYWYALQPVAQGRIEDFANVIINSRPAADLRLDLDGDTLYDAVNLDPDVDPTGASPEFISPQAEAGLPGLGLTWHGEVGCTLPFFGMMNPAPALGSIELVARSRGSRVELTLATALETADVLGYLVQRVDSRGRATVTPTPILARGGEGATYEVSDRLVGAALRELKAGRVHYEVDVLFNDGREPETHGPFPVEAGRRGPD